MIFSAMMIEIISISISMIKIIVNSSITYSSIWGLVPPNCCVCRLCKSLQNVNDNDEDDGDDNDSIDDDYYDNNDDGDDDDKLPWGPSSLVLFHLCGPTGRESCYQNWNNIDDDDDDKISVAPWEESLVVKAVTWKTWCDCSSTRTSLTDSEDPGNTMTMILFLKITPIWCH